jgi:hypothetical protein
LRANYGTFGKSRQIRSHRSCSGTLARVITYLQTTIEMNSLRLLPPSFLKIGNRQRDHDGRSATGNPI